VKKMNKIDEVGDVQAREIVRRRSRTAGDLTSKLGSAIKKKISPVTSQNLTRSLASQQAKGQLGGGATAPLQRRKLGLAASTELDWTNKLVEMITETKKNRGKRKASGAHRNQKLGVGTNVGDARQQVQSFFDRPENKSYGVDLINNPGDRVEANELLAKNKNCVGPACDAMMQSRTKKVPGLRGREGTSLGAGRIDRSLVRANKDTKDKDK